MFPSVLSGDASAALRAFDPTDPRLSLRILMVVESSAGGTGRHVLDLCEGLIRAGAEVHLIYSTTRLDRFFLDRLDTITGLRHTALPMRTQIHPSDPRIIRTVRRYLREHGPFRVIHGHSSKGGAIARLAALGTGVPAFYTLHGFIVMDPGLARWKRLFYRSIEVLLSLATSGIIAVSPEESRAAVRLGLGRSRVRLVPNGIGPLALARRGESRRLLGVSDTTFVVGFVGRLVEQKAPDVLLRSFAHAVAQSPDIDTALALVGSGPLEAHLRELAATLGIDDRVLWLGERDARSLLAGFDVFALSSRKEGLPYVVLEAMAAGLPVVATASSGVEILVESGRNGYVVPDHDVAAFGRALATLAAEPALRASQGRVASREVQRFDMCSMIEGTLAVYLGTAPLTELVARPARPAHRPSAWSLFDRNSGSGRQGEFSPSQVDGVPVETPGLPPNPGHPAPPVTSMA